MAGWRRCDRCRRVLPGEEFDGDATTCRACLALPAAAAPRRSNAVTRSRTTPRPAAAPSAPAGPRPALLGVAGSGDLEVRERRAHRAALEALAQTQPEEFERLLREARSVEGLRPSSAAPAAPPAPPPAAD